MFLLDTDTVVYLLKGNPVVEKNLRRHYNDSLKLSVVSLMELYYGAYKSQRVTSNIAKVRVLESAIEILPLSQPIAEVFGRQKALLEKPGSRLDDFDLLIGCLALANNLILVTNNVDGPVKSLKRRISVIPAKTGIQLFQILKNSLDSGFHRSDDFLRVHQC